MMPWGFTGLECSRFSAYSQKSGLRSMPSQRLPVAFAARVVAPVPLNMSSTRSPPKPAAGAFANEYIIASLCGSTVGNGAGCPPVRLTSSGYIGQICMLRLRHSA